MHSVWSGKTLILALAIGAGACIQARFGLPYALGTAGLAAGVAFFPIVLRQEELRKPAKRKLRSEIDREPEGRSRALIVGAGELGQTLAARLEKSGRYQVIGFVDDEEDAFPECEWPILGKRDATTALVRQHAVDSVFLAYAPTWQQRLAEDLAGRHPDVRVQVVPSFYEAMMPNHQVDTIGDIALVPLAGSAGRVRRGMKRGCDIACGLLGLVALSPVMLAVALIVKLTSRGPVLFAQERVGQYGRRFRLYKFRTMRQDAEAQTGPILSSGVNDARLTPVGKWLRVFRIDELPQFWNVLRGEMSLVGPRPERPFFVETFAARNPVYVRRHAVRPGITGLAQIYAGYHTDARDKLRFDLIYISHQSLGLDIMILLRTLALVARSRGC